MGRGPADHRPRGRQASAVGRHPAGVPWHRPRRGSPEDLFAASAASCLAVTIAALADQHQVALRNLDVRAEAVVGRRPDGRFGFVAIEQTVTVEVEGDDEGAVRSLVAKAEETCLVAVSVDLPVTTTVDVKVLGWPRAAAVAG